jgi:hypothetical protein
MQFSRVLGIHILGEAILGAAAMLFRKTGTRALPGKIFVASIGKLTRSSRSSPPSRTRTTGE